MNIEITGRQIEITPALREFTSDKLRKLERLLDGPLDVHVVLAVEKHRHLAEIQVNGHRPFPELHGTRLAQALDRPPGAVSQLNLHVPMERHHPIAARFLERVRASDAPRHAHRAVGQAVRRSEIVELGNGHGSRAAQSPSRRDPGSAAADRDHPDNQQHGTCHQHGQKDGDRGRHAGEYGVIAR